MKRTVICLISFLIYTLPALCQSQTGVPVTMKVNWFDLRDVRLLEGPFQEAMFRNQRYLLALEPDRLLHMFRVTAGMTSHAIPYGGWEGPGVELRGHSLGHYLSAISMMYAGTGDERFGDRTRYIVAVLDSCQQALPGQGYNPGYLSAFPESFIDRVETGQAVWAPWYTLHKILAGLLDAYRYAGDKTALNVLVRMADWIDFRVSRLSTEQMQKMLETEFGGMNDVLAQLYGVTRDEKYLRLARAFEHQRILKPLIEGRDTLDSLHANTQIPKLIGAATEYELTGEPDYAAAASTFWERVALYRSYVIGGHSDHEHFFPISQFGSHLSAETAETCNTYNMLKLTRHLFQWNPSVQTMDFYERGLYNHILASQDPGKGMFVYLTSLQPGHFKSYSTPDSSFWCCVGTGMENHTKYQDTIYGYHTDTLFVNLFMASELDWKAQKIRLRQETRFPEEETTNLVISAEKPTRFTLRFRYPNWVNQPVTVTLNGTPVPIGKKPGTYVSITRTWQDGDRLAMTFPMGLRTEDLPGNPQIKALLYGPVVLAGQLGTNDLPDPYVINQWDLSKVPTPEVPVFIYDGPDWLKQVKRIPDRPLGFRTQGLGHPNDVTLLPFYETHHQRYTVYWNVMDRQAGNE